MTAASVRQGAAAHNSANLLTEDSRRLIVSQSEVHSGGVKAELQRSEEAADVVADALDRLVSLYSLKANVVTLRTADKMVGTVLDVLA
jgi:hypothetical protein